MRKLSVIIPVYNIQNYIIKCLDSLHRQNYKNVEFLIIDDGSTDQSSEYIKRYLDNSDDNRFSYFYKTNGGLSDARNYGMLKASGEYIWYFDGDDYMPDDSELIGKLINKAEENKLEMLIFNFQYDENWPMKYANHAFDLKSNNCVQKGTDILNGSVFRHSIWHILFERNFLLKNKITFEKGSTVEDLIYTTECLLQSQRVLIYPLVAYVYAYRSDSITGSTNLQAITKRINDVIDTTVLLDEKLRKKDIQSSELVSGFIAESMMACATGYVSVSIKKMKNFFKGKKLNLKELIKKIILLYTPKRIRRLLCKRILNVR